MYAQRNQYTEPVDLTEEGGWAESKVFEKNGSSSSSETDWAAIVGAALGGTAAIIRAAEGTSAPVKPPTAPTFDPYAAQKAAAGPPTWVYMAGGALLLVVLLGQRK
jgi:hypothetical protein